MEESGERLETASVEVEEQTNDKTFREREVTIILRIELKEEIRDETKLTEPWGVELEEETRDVALKETVIAERETEVKKQYSFFPESSLM